MHFHKKYKSFVIGSSTIDLRRTEEGLIEIVADDEIDFQKALGFVHAHDRIAQMVTSRAIGRGRLSEGLGTKEMYRYDALSRKLRFYQVDDLVLEGKIKNFAEAYCEGVNTYLQNHSSPVLTTLFGKIDLWQPIDILRLIKVYMYLGMAQTQERIEKFLIQAIQEGVSLDKLKKLFFPHLQGLSEEILAYIREAYLAEPFLEAPFHPPGFSNNWVVSSSKSNSGSPLMCFDPHLVVNHLPSFWYEVSAHLQSDYRIGVTIPGIPALIMGRSRSLAASFTYGMMDTIDFFIEECKDGHYKRDEKWIPLHERKEEIKRKGLRNSSIIFYETDLGVLETGGENIRDGKYFCLAWSGIQDSANATLKVLANLWECQTVLEAQNTLKECAMSCNWLLADRAGHIGYQQSGKLPNRAHSGLYPIPGWIQENRWAGFASGESLKSIYDPECGYLFTANDDQNQPGKAITVNVPFANYRAKRIENVLSEKSSFTIEEMQQLQSDLYSNQAAAFMNCIREFIPSTPVGEILQSWDLHYDSLSIGATLFEAFYSNVMNEIFGKNMFGEEAWEYIVQTSLHFFLHGNLDAFLLQEKKEDLKEILLKTLAQFNENKIPTWGESRIFWMKHMLLGKTATKLLRNDVGPLILPGSLATVAVGHFFNEKERSIVVGQSYRFSTDLSKDLVESILAGGASGHIFSSYFASEVKKWSDFKYKQVFGDQKP